MFIYMRLLIFCIISLSIFSFPLSLKDKIRKYKNFNNIYLKNYPNSTNITNSTTNRTTMNISNLNLTNITNTTYVKILFAYGDLYEYKMNQSLHLVMNTSVNPLEITNLTFIELNKSTLYKPRTRCFYESNVTYRNVTDVNCILDLNDMKKGNYLISYFYYKNKRIYDNYTLIRINENKEKKKDNKTEKIELINVSFNSNLYSKYQNLTLYFSNNNTKSSLINGITIYNTHIAMYFELTCISKGSNNSVICPVDFSNVDTGYYNVMYYEYNHTFYNASNYIRFYVYQKSEPIHEDLKLLGIYGEAFSKNISNLTLVFNKNVNPNNYSSFYLIDRKSMYRYYINFIIHRTYNTSMNVSFDLTNVPKGNYNIMFYYNRKNYTTNITLNVKEKEVLSENELIEIYHNFKRYKDNQVAYFSFYGKNKTNYLAYIVLNDGYSKINVLQTLGCTIVSSNAYGYDLKCNLNLTYVNEGKYTISEYYINNQHYNTKKDIVVIVQ